MSHKIKKKPQQKPQAKPKEIIALTNYLNLAIMIRSLNTVYDWDKEQLEDFVYSYVVLMQEVMDKRTTVLELIRDTKELTGIDAKKIIDDVCGLNGTRFSRREDI